jgi:hypothetical protein
MTTSEFYVVNPDELLAGPFDTEAEALAYLAANPGNGDEFVMTTGACDVG